jgi:hypothetical protein
MDAISTLGSGVVGELSSGETLGDRAGTLRGRESARGPLEESPNREVLVG